MPAIQDSGIANLIDRVSKKSSDFYSRWGHYPDRLLISSDDAILLREGVQSSTVSFKDVRLGVFEFGGMKVLVTVTPGILEVFRVG